MALLLGAERVVPFRYLRTGAESRPWVGGHLAVEVRGHLVVVTDRSDRTLIDDLADAASADIARVSKLLRQPADTRVLVDATSSGSAMSLNSNGSGDAAAVTYPVLAQRASGAAALAGWRIKMNPRRTLWPMLDPKLLRHEISH